MQEESPQTRSLLDKINRQFNECNALYHTVAQRCGLSDAAFWVLYALYSEDGVWTQNRIAAEWGLPRQTLNSAVSAMAKKGLVELCPGKGAHSGKIITLTAEGRTLAARTVGAVIAAEQETIADMSLPAMETYWRIGQAHLNTLKSKFEKLPELQ